MFDGLNKIDWESVRHHHGPAANVPKLLQDLVSKDRKAQSLAIHALFNILWNHGTVYEATAKAVPFLYEVLESPFCFERFSVVWLLAAIANRSLYRQGQDPEKKNDGLRVWEENARVAVRQGVGRILRLLHDKDEDLRLPVILLLASLPEEAALIKPELLETLAREERDETRAGLGLALALLGEFHLEAFQCKNTKLPLVLLETLAKACMQNEGMRDSAFQTIEQCFLATVGQEDKNWLDDEKILLKLPNLN
jgi:hypothetical protein